MKNRPMGWFTKSLALSVLLATTPSFAGVQDLDTLQVPVKEATAVRVYSYAALSTSVRRTVDRWIAEIPTRLADGCQSKIGAGYLMSTCQNGTWICTVAVNSDASYIGGACINTRGDGGIFW